MPRQIEHRRELSRHRGVFLEVRLRRDGFASSALARNRAPPFNSAMEQTKPGLDGASQLIARLNGKRSPASRPSACGYGAPPPDHGPRLNGRRHSARSVSENGSGLAPAPAAAPWLRFG
jgi:hypothetical protein